MLLDGVKYKFYTPFGHNMHSFYFGYCLHLTDFEFDDVINKRQDDPTHKIMKKKKLVLKKKPHFIILQKHTKKSSFFNFLKNKKKKTNHHILLFSFNFLSTKHLYNKLKKGERTIKIQNFTSYHFSQIFSWIKPHRNKNLIYKHQML